MEVKNVNELRMDFPISYMGQTIIIKYGEVRELPDGAVPMEGIAGWLICRSNLINIPNLIEIDLSTLPIYKADSYELTEEQEIKAEQALEESMKETLAKLQTKEKNYEQDNKAESNTDNQGNQGSSQEGSTEHNSGISQVNTTESQKDIHIEEYSEVNSFEDTLNPLVSYEEMLDKTEVSNVPLDKPMSVKRPLEGKRINKGIYSRIGKKKLHSRDSKSKNQSEKQGNKKQSKE